jgi:hypothetical protein
VIGKINEVFSGWAFWGRVFAFKRGLVSNEPAQDILVKDDGQWLSLPLWARFLFDLGDRVSVHERSEQIVVSVSLPIRSYAAAMASFGVVLGTLRTASGGDEQGYFRQLCSMRTGTRVFFSRSGRLLKARLDGVDSLRDGRTVLRVQVEKEPGGTERRSGGKTYLLFREQVGAITLAGREQRWDLPREQKGRRVLSPYDAQLLRTFLVSSVARPLVTDPLCAIVAEADVIRQEVDSRIALGSPETIDAEGALQDVLRADRFVGQGQPCYSMIVPVSAWKRGPPVGSDRAPIVVFDGSKAFLRWRGLWPHSHWIVILDRTERDFGSAVETLNEAYTAYRRETANLDHLPSPPGGVEMMAYVRSQ